MTQKKIKIKVDALAFLFLNSQLDQYDLHMDHIDLIVDLKNIWIKLGMRMKNGS
jgi:hypothetical protein